MTGGKPRPSVIDVNSIPPDRILRWPRTDANGRINFPTNTEEVPDRLGRYNFHKLQVPSDGLHVSWRLKLGTYLAEEVDKKPHVAGGYMMKDLPKGYEMYVHHKSQDNGKMRHDVYLFGPDNTDKLHRYRSVNEFLPHAKWLYDVNNNSPCGCKYCSDAKFQTEITAKLGAPHITGFSARPSMGSTHRNHAKPQTRHPPVDTKVPRKLRSAKTANETSRASTSKLSSANSAPRPARSKHVHEIVQSLESTREYVHPDLLADLTQNRAFRRGELVWASVHPPLVGTNPGEVISYWPGVVMELHLKITFEKVAPEENDEIKIDYPKPSPSSNPAPVPERTRRVESHVFEVKLLGTHQSDTYYESQLLPLPAIRMTSAFLQRCTNFVTAEFEFDAFMGPSLFSGAAPSRDTFFKRCRSFRPVLKTAFDVEEASPRPSFNDAILPIVVALRTVEHIASQYRTDFLWGQKAATNTSSRATVPDAALASSLASSRKGKAPEHSVLVARAQASAPARLSLPRFQGLWWGAERIWLGDLVRLLPIKREEFPPRVQVLLQSPAAEEFKQGRTGLFLHVRNILGEEPQTGGTLFAEQSEVYQPKKQFIEGYLYELVRGDWADPNETLGTDSSALPSNPVSHSTGPSTVSSSVNPSRQDLSSITQSKPDASSTQSNANHETQDTLSGNATPAGTQPNQPLQAAAIFPLPDPPPKSKWRAMLPRNMAIDIPLDMIAGRYYSHLLENPVFQLTPSDLDRAVDLGSTTNSMRDPFDDLFEDGHESLFGEDEEMDTGLDQDVDADMNMDIDPANSRDLDSTDAVLLAPLRPASLVLQYASILALAGFPSIPLSRVPHGDFVSQNAVEDVGHKMPKVWSAGREDMLEDSEDCTLDETWRWVMPEAAGVEDSLTGDEDRYTTPTPGTHH